MNAQQEAVALWMYLESRQIRPSVRKVVAMMRGAAIGVNDADAGRWLAPFAAAAPHPKAHRSKNPAFPQQDSSTPDAQIQHNHSTTPALYARDKVSLSTKPTLTGSVVEPESLSLLAAAPSEPVKPEKAVKPRRVPSAADLEAYRLLEGLWARISPHMGRGLTGAIWKRNNKRSALEMLESGVPVEEWLEFWDESAAAGYPYRVLKNFQAGFANRGGRRETAQNESDLLPTVTDLIAAGQIDAAEMNAAVMAERPAWFTAKLAAATAGA